MEHAADVYRLEIIPASRWRRIWAPVVILVASVVSFDMASNPGGRTLRIIDEQSGRVLDTVTESFGDDVDDPVSMVVADHERLTADEFARPLARRLGA